MIIFTEQDISIVEMNAKDARIAELEAERDRLFSVIDRLFSVIGGLYKASHDDSVRIAELEAERDRMQGYADEEADARDNAERLRRAAEARIEELEAAVLAEREACAKIAEDWHSPQLTEAGLDIAVAIRARPAP